MAPPTLILTRPHKSAETFAASLDPVARAAVRVVIAPLMEIVPTDALPALGAKDRVIFTSANGVRFAPDALGREAYCVGSQTTQFAIENGWNARQSGNTAQELIGSLLPNPPSANLVHLGGEHTIGDIAGTLTANGIYTRHVTLYSQVLVPLNEHALAALKGPSIVPVFSPRSAEQLVREAKNGLGMAHIIALSDSVASAFDGESTATCVTLPSPQAIYMRKVVENLCRTLSLP